MIKFRFPIAIAHICAKRGFNKALAAAKAWAIIATPDGNYAVNPKWLDTHARDFVDSCMKARLAEFAEMAYANA